MGIFQRLASLLAGGESLVLATIVSRTDQRPGPWAPGWQ